MLLIPWCYSVDILLITELNFIASHDTCKSKIVAKHEKSLCKPNDLFSFNEKEHIFCLQLNVI